MNKYFFHLIFQKLTNSQQTNEMWYKIFILEFHHDESYEAIFHQKSRLDSLNCLFPVSHLAGAEREWMNMYTTVTNRKGGVHVCIEIQTTYIYPIPWGTRSQHNIKSENDFSPSKVVSRTKDYELTALIVSQTALERQWTITCETRRLRLLLGSWDFFSLFVTCTYIVDVSSWYQIC